MGKRRKFSLLTIFVSRPFLVGISLLCQMTNSAQSKDLNIQSKNSLFVSLNIGTDDKLSHQKKTKTK